MLSPSSRTRRGLVSKTCPIYAKRGKAQIYQDLRCGSSQWGFLCSALGLYLWMSRKMISHSPEVFLQSFSNEAHRCCYQMVDTSLMNQSVCKVWVYTCNNLCLFLYYTRMKAERRDQGRKQAHLMMGGLVQCNCGCSGGLEKQSNGPHLRNHRELKERSAKPNPETFP